MGRAVRCPLPQPFIEPLGKPQGKARRASCAVDRPAQVQSSVGIPSTSAARDGRDETLA